MIDEDVVSQLAMKPVPQVSVPVPMPKTAVEILRSRQAPKFNDDPMAIAKNAVDLVGNPDDMLRVVEQSGSDLENVAPETARDVRETMSRLLFFLATKAPKEQPSAPGMPPLPAPKQDMLRFQRYVKAIDNPLGILDDAANGSLSPEAVEAVKMVYPSIFETMQAELAGRIQNAPKIPYTRRMQLSALLGQDMTGTLRPSVAMAAQGAYASAGQASAAPQQVPLSRASKLNMADRAEYNTAARKEAQRGVGMWNRKG